MASLKQTNSATSGSSYVSTISVSLGSVSTASGLVLFDGASSSTPNFITSVTDDKGNSWSRVSSQSADFRSHELWVASNAKPGTTTITVTTSSALRQSVIVHEVVGVATSSLVNSFSVYKEPPELYIQNHNLSITTTDYTYIIAGYIGSDTTSTYTIPSGWFNLTQSVNAEGVAVTQSRDAFAPMTYNTSFSAPTYENGSGFMIALNAVNSAPISDNKPQPLSQKSYEYRVFDKSFNFIGVLDNVTSDFSYSQAINENASELNITVGRSPNNRTQIIEPLLDMANSPILDQSSTPITVPTDTANAVGPGTDIDLNYNVEVFAFYGGFDELLDQNGSSITDINNEIIYTPYGNPNGIRVYSGYIADYELLYGKNSGVNIVLVPQATDQSHIVFKSGTATTITYNSTDPVLMARNNMDNYISQGGVIRYTNQTMPLSGQSTSYIFKLQTTREVNDKSIELLPSGWFHYVHPGENLQYLLPKSTVANHTFYYEQHITSMKLRKSITQLVNKVYFTGGDTGAGQYLYRYYEDAASQTTYRSGLQRLADSRVTTANGAQALATKEIETYKNPRYRTSVVITDVVYDIETIRLGEMVAFRNFGTFVDTLLLQIVNLVKEKHRITLDLDMVVPNDTKRLLELKEQLLSEEIRNIASTPS